MDEKSLIQRRNKSYIECMKARLNVALVAVEKAKFDAMVSIENVSFNITKANCELVDFLLDAGKPCTVADFPKKLNLSGFNKTLDKLGRIIAEYSDNLTLENASLSNASELVNEVNSVYKLPEFSEPIVNKKEKRLDIDTIQEKINKGKEFVELCQKRLDAETCELLFLERQTNDKGLSDVEQQELGTVYAKHTAKYSVLMNEYTEAKKQVDDLNIEFKKALKDYHKTVKL